METKDNQIRSALRMLWLRSGERAEALKRDGYCCVKCNRKQSKAQGREIKLNVHHKEGVGNWDKIIEVIREELLCSPEHLETLCKDCHDRETWD